MGMAMELLPSPTDTTVRVWLSGKASPALRAAVEKTLREVLPKNFKPGGVRTVTPFLGAVYRLEKATDWASSSEVSVLTIPGPSRRTSSTSPSLASLMALS